MDVGNAEKCREHFWPRFRYPQTYLHTLSNVSSINLQLMPLDDISDGRFSLGVYAIFDSGTSSAEASSTKSLYAELL